MNMTFKAQIFQIRRTEGPHWIYTDSCELLAKLLREDASATADTILVEAPLHLETRGFDSFYEITYWHEEHRKYFSVYRATLGLVSEYLNLLEEEGPLIGLVNVQPRVLTLN